MSGSLWPRGLQHSRLPCPSPTPRACSNSCPWSWWCHPTISSSVVPLSSCPQSFLASESFPVSRLFASGSWILPSQLAWEISEKTGCFEVWKAGPFITASPRGFNAAHGPSGKICLWIGHDTPSLSMFCSETQWQSPEHSLILFLLESRNQTGTLSGPQRPTKATP